MLYIVSLPSVLSIATIQQNRCLYLYLLYPIAPKFPKLSIFPITPNDSNDLNDPIHSLNLPSIALRLSLGLNRLRLSIVYIGISSAFGLHDFPLFHRAVKLTRVE